ncbi:acyl carrier protein [Streptomyces sp. NPDC056910]|uniref:acyl carrier protein n=1 Tax=Streptomyces sp. NPDC056910 TaxID=3345964 RepID=UPI00368A4778
MEDSGVTMRADTTIQDRYRLQHLLGAGGFGQVWKATDRTLEREVAVKIATSLADDPQAVARFTAEARKLARLHHSGIVTVHDAGTIADDDQTVPYLVMELLDGSTWQKSSSVESVESVVRTGASLAEALAHMHEMGIVHRDIKPANIMICADGNAVLMDLGIARDFSTLTTVTAAVSPGTLAYMAPEQFSGASASVASDVYALGLVLIEKITGKRGPAVQLPATDRTALAPNLRALLDRMTALDPGERPSAAECRGQLCQSVLPREPAPEPAPAGGSTPIPITRARQEHADLAAAQEEILTGLAEIVTEIADIPIEAVQLDSSFKRDLGVDSLAMVEIAVAAEMHFGISIPDKHIKNLKTIRDATDYVLKALRSQ